MLRRNLIVAATSGLLVVIAGCATDKVGSGDETSETARWVRLAES
jgi:hypothetical protein